MNKIIDNINEILYIIDKVKTINFPENQSEILNIDEYNNPKIEVYKQTKEKLIEPKQIEEIPVNKIYENINENPINKHVEIKPTNSLDGVEQVNQEDKINEKSTKTDVSNIIDKVLIDFDLFE